MVEIKFLDRDKIKSLKKDHKKARNTTGTVPTNQDDVDCIGKGHKTFRV